MEHDTGVGGDISLFCLNLLDLIRHVGLLSVKNSAIRHSPSFALLIVKHRLARTAFTAIHPRFYYTDECCFLQHDHQKQGWKRAYFPADLQNKMS